MERPEDGEWPERGSAPLTAEQALRASNRLLQALTEVQTEFIQGAESPRLFNKLLAVLLELTGSEYGFIGEVVYPPEGSLFLRSRAITNIAWTPELREFLASRLAAGGLEFRNLKNLFGEVLTRGVVVMSNHPETDPRRGGLPEGHPPLLSFLGLPFHAGGKLVGMVGVANRRGGYNTAIIDFLQPLLATCCALLQGVHSEEKRRVAEESQRRSDASFRTLIEHSPDALVIHRAGRVLFANPTAVGLLGYTCREELEGRPVAELVQPGEEELLLVPSQDGALREVRFRHREGRGVLGEVAVVSLRFDGEPAVVAIARDITERRQVQEKLRSTERMASLGTLAAGVAHEINNPLSYLLSNLRFMNDELQDLARTGESVAGERGQEVREALKEALVGSERVREIVRDLKSFSRQGDEQREPVDVHAVLDSCVNLAWSEIRHRARLVKSYGQVPPVLGNASRLGQVFLNLLVNAAQAIPEGSALEAQEIHLSTWHEERWVGVAVRDTGVGIPPENRARLFSAFFTTKPEGVGTGLGLSICQGIVVALGGRITVESEPGKGSTFRVLLPVAGAARPDGAAPGGS
jgi:PAS domain S-box-containing protein